MHKQFLCFFQTSLQLSWMLFGGNHRTLLGAQMNISQEMTSWLKVNNSVLIKMSCLNWSPGCVSNCNCPCGQTWSIFGHPLCTMEQTRGIPGKTTQSIQIWMVDQGDWDLSITHRENHISTVNPKYFHLTKYSNWILVINFRLDWMNCSIHLTVHVLKFKSSA